MMQTTFIDYKAGLLVTGV